LNLVHVVDHQSEADLTEESSDIPTPHMTHFAVDVVMKGTGDNHPTFANPVRRTHRRVVTFLSLALAFHSIFKILKPSAAVVVSEFKHILVGGSPAGVGHTGFPDVVLVGSLEQHRALGCGVRGSSVS
jgi:hypothetical protein